MLLNLGYLHLFTINNLINVFKTGTDLNLETQILPLKMFETGTDVQITIVNRSKTYHVPKKLLCTKIPYFERLFSSETKEPKENQVVLDFNERYFEFIIDYLNNALMIQFSNVIALYDIADHLQMDQLKNTLQQFFSTYTIDHVGYMLDQISETSKLVNSEMLDCFYKRHFGRIVDSKAFIFYTFKTLDHILKLDLWIKSEYQVFEAIVRWIEHDVDSRKQHLPQLMWRIRWSFVNDADFIKINDHQLTKKFGKSSVGSQPKEAQVASRLTRNVFIAICGKDRVFNSNLLYIFYLESDNSWTRLGVFSKKLGPVDSIFCNEKHIDIIYDSGHGGVRLDLTDKTFHTIDKPINRINKLSSMGPMDLYHRCSFDDRNKQWRDVLLSRSDLHYDRVVESNGKVVLMDSKSRTFFWSDKFGLHSDMALFDHGYGATIFNEKVCIFELTKGSKIYNQEIQLTCLDIGSKTGSVIDIPEKLFHETSLAGNDTYLLIADTKHGKFLLYDGRTGNYTCDKVQLNNKLITVASLEIPIHYLSDS